MDELKGADPKGFDAEPPIALLHKAIDVEASFSSYLYNGGGENERDEEEDTEISVFEARKYFDGGMKEADLRPLQANRSLHRYPPASSPVESCNRSTTVLSKSRSVKAATASSEASWNSRTGLLPSQGSPRLSKHASTSKEKGSRWNLGQKCACFCKKSVQISRPAAAVDPKPIKSQSFTSLSSVSPVGPRGGVSTAISPKYFVSSSRLLKPSTPTGFSKDQSDAGFSFPVLTHTSIATVAPARDIFDMLEQRRNRCVVFPNNPECDMKGGHDVEEDEASDGSSDLFELESFSTQTASSHPINYSSAVRQDLINEVTSQCYYEPSEASIAWSVNTADTGSVANLRAGEESGRGGNKRRVGNGLLISCRGHKAVMVGGSQRRQNLQP